MTPSSPIANDGTGMAALATTEGAPDRDPTRQAAADDLVNDLRVATRLSRAIPVPDFLLDDFGEDESARYEALGQISRAAWDLAVEFLQREGYVALITLDERLERLQERTEERRQRIDRKLGFLDLMTELEGLAEQHGPDALIEVLPPGQAEPTNAVATNAVAERDWIPWNETDEVGPHRLYVIPGKLAVDASPSRVPINGVGGPGPFMLDEWVRACREHANPEDWSLMVERQGSFEVAWEGVENLLRASKSVVEREREVLDLRRSVVGHVRYEYEVYGRIPEYDLGQFEPVIASVIARAVRLQHDEQFVLEEAAHLLHKNVASNLQEAREMLQEAVKSVDPEAKLAFRDYEAMYGSLRRRFHSGVKEMKEKGRRAISPDAPGDP